MAQTNMAKSKFIQWTKFTSGPWQMHPYFEGVYGPNGEFVCLTVKPGMAVKPHTKSNAQLIAASPLMVSTLFDAYLMLQRLANKSVGTAITTDSVRATLRNTLCEATGAGGQELQEFIEGMAFENPL